MTAPASHSASTSPANGTSPRIVVKRIRFVDRAPPGARVLREFTQPRPCIAVEEGLELGELPPAPEWPEPTDQLVVVFVPKGAGAEWQKRGAGWLAPPDHPEAMPAALVERDGYTVQWRPGRAVVLGRIDCPDVALAALADFAFHEGELRGLEQLEACEAGAQEDVARAHRIRFRDRKHWAHFGERIEHLSRMRLAYARLEPRLAKPPRNLPIEARRVMARLLTRTDVEARLEALTERLEACEDLYEGANDRVADYRWYFGGHVLEVTIILLLVLEALLMGAELYLRYREWHVS